MGFQTGSQTWVQIGVQRWFQAGALGELYWYSNEDLKLGL